MYLIKQTLYLFLVVVLHFQSFAQNTAGRQEYINKYAQIAMDEMKRVGIPASITLAQGCLESGNGKSMLAEKANNHFGIKCHSTWTGKKIYKDDDAKNECFRVYKDADESFVDHSDFLKNGQRYAFLFELKPDDYKGWAKGLKKAGYATNPHYPERLITIIEESELYKYDEMVLSGKSFVAPNDNAKSDKEKHTKKTKQEEKQKQETTTLRKKETRPVQKQLDPQKKSVVLTPPVLADVSEFSIDAPGRVVHTNNKVNYVFAKYDDTFESIAKDYALSDWQIIRFNDFEKDHKLVTGEVIYIQPKKTKADKKYPYHIVRENETLQSISQLYAVKLSSLMKINQFNEGYSVKTGDRIKLKK